VKSAVFAPVMPTLVMFRVAVPLLVSVALCDPLMAPTFCEPNVRMGGNRLTPGAGGGGGVLFPPPPHATQAPTTRSADAISQPGERRLAEIANVPRTSNPANSQNKAIEGRKLSGTFGSSAGGVALDAPPVVIVRVEVTDAEPVRVTEAGENEHPMLVPGVTQLRTTVPVRPATGAIVTTDVPDCPGAPIVMVLGLVETLKSVTLIVTAGEVVELA